MPMSSGELDRLADDMYKDRRITGSVYCRDCGYNLKSLPYRHRCPECGNEYNARPLTQTGIFSPHEGDFPYGDIFMFLACAGSAVVLGWGAMQTRDWWQLFGGGLFVVLALISLNRTINRLVRFFKTGAIIRRIQAEEDASR